MDDEDGPITIDHLVGVSCILNASVKVKLRKNRQIGNRLELFTEGSSHFFLVRDVVDMTADGGYVVTLTNRKGSVISDKSALIAESMYKPQTRKGATN